jgi:hypothetical protein
MSWYIGLTISMFNCNIGLSFAKLTDLSLFIEHKNKKKDVDVFIQLNNEMHSISDFIQFTSKLPKETYFLSYLITAKNLKSNTDTCDPSDPNMTDVCIYDCYYYCDSSSNFLYLVDVDEDDVYQLVDT